MGEQKLSEAASHVHAQRFAPTRAGSNAHRRGCPGSAVTEGPLTTPDAMAGWWGRPPEAAKTAGTHGISAGYWQFRTAEPMEIFGEADPLVNIVCIQTASFRHDTFVDGRLAYRGQAHRGMANVVRAGERPSSILYDSFSCLQIYVPCSHLRDLGDEIGRPPAEGLTLIDPALARDPILSDLGRQIIAEMRLDDGPSRLAFDGLSMALCAHLLRRWSNLRYSSNALNPHAKKGGLSPWQVNRIHDLLEANISSDLSLPDLASEVRLSAFHFARAFKASTGLAPHAYQMGLRLQRAQRLLAETDWTIGVIAAEVGYADQGALTRLFQKTLGVTPSLYRRARRP
jgi:AraC-like DNA-binding protein